MVGRIVLVASLLLNLFLLVVLFFRTAFNEIFVKWWAQKQERRSEARTRMMELHRIMNSFEGDYFMTLALLATGTANDARVAGEKLIGAQEFLAAHELKFPPAIRRLVEQLRKEIVLPGGLASLR